MGTGYTRNDTADNIADGNIINASDLDGEFDALQSAFDNSTGHTHDGTAGEGAPIEKVGPNQEVVVTSNVLRPAANNTIDLGVQTTNEFKDLWLDGTAYLDSVDIDGGTIDGLSVLTVDNLSLNGNTITSTDTNGNLNLRANGDGIISVDATDVNFGDSDKATFGDGSDLQIYHDGSHSYIDDVGGTGNIKIRATNLVLQSAISEDYATFIANGAATLFYDNAAKIATTATGISVTGDVQASDDLILASDSSKITFGADGDIQITHNHNAGLILENTLTTDNESFVLTLQSNEDTIITDEQLVGINFNTNSTAGGVSAGTQAAIRVKATGTYSSTVAGSRVEFYTTETDGTLSRAMYLDDDQSVHFTGPSANVKLDATNSTLDFPDNFKIMIGAGDDLQIYHDGAGSYISDQGVGPLNLLSGGVRLKDTTDTTTMLAANAGGSVTLYYNDSPKLATTDTGVDVTGTVTADGLTVDGSATVNSNTFEISSTTPSIRLTETDVVGENTQLIQASGSFRIRTASDDYATTTERMRIDHSTGDISFYEDTGTTAKFFWDASAESLGIGTTSPSNLLDIQSSTASGGMLELNNTGDTSRMLFISNSDGMIIRSNNSASGAVAKDTIFQQGTVEAMRIDSSGNVGIGTSSPSGALHVSRSGLEAGITLERTTSATAKFTMAANDGNLVFTDQNQSAERMRIDSSGDVSFNGSSGTAGTVKGNGTVTISDNHGSNNGGGLAFHYTGNSGYSQIYVKNNNTLIFDADPTAVGGSTNIEFNVDGSEAMRIDSDGRLLVGKTSDDDTTTGLVVNGNGLTKIVRSSGTANANTVLQLNRRTTDGDITRFQKDGTTVGSIVTSSGLVGLNNGNTALTVDDSTNSIHTRLANGTLRDGSTSLGKSDSRFKDLYLSEGVYLGGTGAANKLDDYEEGTWDPVYLGLTSNPTCTYDIQAGYYTKVGNLVTCTGRIRTDAVSGGSGVLALGGLPFNSKNVATNGSSGTLQVGKYLAWKSGQFAPKMGFVQDTTNYCTLLYEDNDTSAGNCDVAALNNTTNDNDMFFSITYLSA